MSIPLSGQSHTHSPSSPSVCPFTYPLSILSLTLFIHSSIHPSIYLFLPSSIHSVISQSIHLSTNLPIHSPNLSTHPSTCLLMHPTFNPPIHPSFRHTLAHPCIHPSIHSSSQPLHPIHSSIQLSTHSLVSPYQPLTFRTYLPYNLCLLPI